MPSLGSKPRWIQSALAEHRKGALHRDLGVPIGETLSRKLLLEAIKYPERFKSAHKLQVRLQRRARLALRLKGYAEKERRR